MAQSAFSEQMNFGSGKLVEGQKYTVELTDIIKQVKCVAFKEALRGKKDANGKSIIGKEYDTLSPELKKLVDETPAEYWPLRSGETQQREKAKFVDRMTFQFREPESDIKFLYDAQFDIPSKKLSNFITQATGIAIKGDEGYTLGNLFKKGDKFVATIVKKGTFLGLDTDTIVKEALVGPIVAANKSELSATAQKLLEYIKKHLVGKPKATVFDLFENKKFGTYAETQKAWAEITRSGIKVSLDGKTFGFPKEES
jgi:hypothetical protein